MNLCYQVVEKIASLSKRHFLATDGSRMHSSCQDSDDFPRFSKQASLLVKRYLTTEMW